MATKFEPELGEAPPTKEERAEAEKFLKEARRPEKERREKAEPFPGEVPPKPITEKFPGEAPPFPVGYTPPEGKVAEVDAKGRPTVIVTSAGLRQYTPNATMFKMGYVNSDQYAKSGVARGDKTVAATAFLPITSEKGEALMIDKDVAFALQSRKPREQFKAMQEMGIIESGSRFITADDGEWSYQTARSVKKEKEFITKSAIFEQYDQKLQVSRDFKKSHIKLPDDNWVSINDWNKLEGKYQTIGLRQGFDAMNNAMLGDAKDFREVNTQLPDETWFDNADLMGIRTSSPKLYDILTKKGYGAYQGAITDAKASLSDYHDPQKDSYDVASALLTRKPKLTNAVNLLFDQKDIDRIKFEHMPGLTIGTGKKEVLMRAIPGLAAAGVVVTATPIPFDDVIFWAALTGLGIYSGFKVKEIVQEFKSQTGRSPTPADIITVDSKGKAATALQMMPELQRFPGLIPPFIDIKGETIKPTRVDFQEAFKKFTLPQYREGVKGVTDLVAVFLPTPATTIEDVTKTRAGFMAAQAVVDVAEKNLKVATKTIPIDWDKILAEANKAQEQRQLEAAFATINATIERDATPDVRKRYFDAYQDYLRRRMLLESARQSYVESLTPSPIMGKITPEVLDAYTAFAVTDVVSPSIASATRQGISEWVDTYNKAIAKGLTTTQARAAAKTAAQTAIRQALQTMTETKALTQTQIQTLTRTLTRTAVRTATRVIPATRVAVRPLARVVPAEAVATAAPILPPPPLLLPRGGSDKQKRKRIKKSKGAIAWRQGELHGKDVWHVLMHPYESESDYLTVLGRKPPNTTIAKGPGSAFQTIKLLYGKPPARKVTGDIGFMDFFLEPKGAKKVGIGFKPDPKQLTTGDITITRRPPRLPGSGKMRITPRTPKLRR